MIMKRWLEQRRRQQRDLPLRACYIISARARLLLVLGVLCLGFVRDVQGARHALVIGNSEYQHWPPVGSPELDAHLMADLLRRLRFDSVTVLTNAKRKEMQESIDAFLARLDPKSADTALVFYSGHGGSAFRTNYLIPVDLPKEGIGAYRLDDWARSAIDLEVLLERTTKRAATTLLFLNNCLNDVHKVSNLSATQRLYLQERGRRAPSRFLRTGNVAVPSLLISYATAPGHIAISFVKELQRPSRYVRHLVDNLLVPGVELRASLQRVRAAVINETSGFQTPTTDDQLSGDVFLAGSRPPPWRLITGSSASVLGLALASYGVYALAVDGRCAVQTRPQSPGDMGSLCQRYNNSAALGGALLGVGLGVAAGGLALAFVPQRTESLRVSLAPAGLGVRLALSY